MTTPATFAVSLLPLLVAIASVASCGCEPTRQGPAGSPVDSGSTGSDLPDAAVPSDSTGGPSDAWVNEDGDGSEGASPDGAEDGIDLGDGETSGEVDTESDAAISSLCAALALPEPGQPCTEDGAVRCSNAGAEPRDWAIAMGIGCFRPNTVRCKQTADGLRWSLESCESITGGKSGVPIGAGGCAGYMSCVARSGSDHGCQPTTIRHLTPLKSNPVSMQTTTLSKGHSFGGQWCSPTSKNPQLRPGAPPWCNDFAIVQCMPIDSSPFKDQVLAAAGDCAKYLLKGEWTFPIELCQVDQLYCKPKSKFCVLPSYKDKPECKGYYYIGCGNGMTHQDPFYDPVTNKLRCKKDCFEAGAPGYAPGESGTPSP